MRARGSHRDPPNCKGGAGGVAGKLFRGRSPFPSFRTFPSRSLPGEHAHGPRRSVPGGTGNPHFEARVGTPAVQGGGDNSNADFAIWGLDAAAKAGATVRRETWEAALGNWLRGQNADGGWSYSQNPKSTGSMTAAGIASIVICLSHLTTDERQPAKAEQ